jgi:hypothetical protein
MSEPKDDDGYVEGLVDASDHNCFVNHRLKAGEVVNLHQSHF